MAPLAPSDDSWDVTFDLLVLARDGEKAALNLLFEHHQWILQRWARARRPRLAADIDVTAIVHEAILKTLERLDRFRLRSDEAMHAYLRVAVLNGISAELRRMRRSDWPPT